MSDLRAPGEPGRYMPAMDHICGFDGGTNNSPVCGRPASFHLFAGTAEGPGDWTMFACLDHFQQATLLAWDFHEVAAVCDVPGTLWHSEPAQGEGFCFWPEAEAAIHEAVSEPATVTA
jgi:hypothetical protein